MTVIIAGSRGLIGKQIKNYVTTILSEDIVELDLELGDDLCNEEYVKEFFKTKKGKAGAIINLFAFNDHVSPGEKRGTIFDLSLDSFKNSLDVNLTALFSVCREYARNNQTFGGKIINFGASTGIVSARTDMYGGAHKHIGYSVSKAGVIHLTKILATHLAPKFTVNCISPGGVISQQSDEFKAEYSKHTPMNRMCEISDIEPAIAMLLNHDNKYMTGANIVIDGGWSII